jgi:hypothetical protein
VGVFGDQIPKIMNQLFSLYAPLIWREPEVDSGREGSLNTFYLIKDKTSGKKTSFSWSGVEQLMGF